jgi:GNAT superfamily N-acetyltransferase
MLAIKRASYHAARHAALPSVRFEARLESYVDHAFDTQVHSRFNQVFLVFDPAGEPVAAAHGYVRLIDLGGERVEVVRGNTCVRPTHRGAGLSQAAIHHLIRAYSARFALSPYARYFAGLCMHPMMYAFIHQRARRLMPSADKADIRMQRVFEAIFEVAPGAPVPEHAGSHDTAKTLAWLARHRQDPAVQFYLAHNPAYADGFGLPVLMGMNGADFVHIIAQFLRVAAGKALRRR